MSYTVINQINAWKKCSGSKWKHIFCERFIKYFAWKNYLGQSTGGNCLGVNFLEGNYPGVIIQGGQLFRCQLFGSNFSGGHCLGGNCPGGAIVRGQFSGESNCPEGNYPRGNYPGSIYPGGNSSCSIDESIIVKREIRYFRCLNKYLFSLIIRIWMSHCWVAFLEDSRSWEISNIFFAISVSES